VALNSLADVTRMAATLPDALQRAQIAGVTKSALLVTTAIRGEIRAATGDNRLSGVGARGARVGAKYDVKGQVNPSAIISAKGPLHLIERDTSPHLIIPRGRRVGKRGRRLKGGQVLHMANGGYAASALHPGTRGKHPFERGYVKTRGQTGRVFDLEVQRAIRLALK